MKIDLITVMGSPKGVVPSEINSPGVGGAELALMKLSEELGKRGHDVSIYNNPRQRGRHSNVSYLHDYEFDPSMSRDILITFRGPNEISARSNKKKHIGFSTDQFTVGNYVDWYKECDEIIVISKFHKMDHLARYGDIAKKSKILDLGIDKIEYSVDIEKIPYSCIFCSVPDRGLSLLLDMWPQLKATIPQLTLTVTSDYTLWGGSDPFNLQYRLRASSMDGIKFLGKIPRDELIKVQLQSEAQLYPCCLLPGSKIYTSNGLKNIEDIVENDIVLNGSGSYSKVVQKFKRSISDTIYSVKLHGFYKELKITGDHKLLVLRDNQTIWVKGNDLNINDHLLIPKIIDNIVTENYLYPERFLDVYKNYNNRIYRKNIFLGGKNRKDTSIPEKIQYDYDLGLFFGYYVAEGSESDGKIDFTFSSNEIEYISDVVKLGKNLFGLDASIYNFDTYVKINFSSTVLQNLFKNMFGHSKDRQYPPEFLNTNPDFILGLMHGHWRGDCHVDKYSIRLITISEKLAGQVLLFMNRLKYFATLEYITPSNAYSINLSSKFALEFSKDLNKGCYKKGNRWSSKFKENDKFFIIPIKTISTEPYFGYVYDIGINDESHSFVSNGVIVHNCYDENFCLANAESQAAGCYTITSSVGALETTNMCRGRIDVSPFLPEFRTIFVEKAKEFFDLPVEKRLEIQSVIKENAIKRFDWSVIADRFEKEILKI